MPIEFDGTESAEYVLEQALEEFSLRGKAHPHGGTIIYQNNIPFLSYQPRTTSTSPESVCLYRVDTMLLPFFKEAEEIYDNLTNPLNVDETLRAPTIRYIACFGMAAMLGRLMILQSELFGENFEEGKFVTSTFLLHSLAGAMLEGAPNEKALTVKIATETTKKWLDQIVGEAMKKKRDFLVRFINSRPLFHIPTSAGRPKGSTKPEEQKAKDATEFQKQVEDAIRALRSPSGTLPKKTAVAKYLGIGGISPEGSNTHLSTFRTKLKRHNLDYNEIAENMNK
jgi:hypothetical protein